MRSVILTTIVLCCCLDLGAQSGRVTGYSESGTARLPDPPTIERANARNGRSNDDVIRVATDLVTVPVRISARDGKPVRNVARNEFRIYENGVEQQIAYFSNDEQPFTVALVLDMSYSTVFKLDDIRTAARIFILKLREHDRVTVISFDEKPQVLCEPTSDRRVLQLAIEGARIGSGTALYDTLETVIAEKLSKIPGRRAVVLLSDGVDTSSSAAEASSISKRLVGEDMIVYSLRYDTFADVKKNREKNAEIRFDENDRAYVVQRPPEKGEREADYQRARSFLQSMSNTTGGRVYDVSSATNLNDAFTSIASELRKIYSIGYYPAEDRHPGRVYDIKVRVYRPNLKITTRNQYHGK